MVIEPHPNINLYEEQKVPRREMLVDGVAFQIRYHCEDVPKFLASVGASIIGRLDVRIKENVRCARTLRINTEIAL